MFESCFSLTSLDISNFYLPRISSMKNMFYRCYSLTSLNLSNVKPNNYIIITENLFYNCSSLFFLDISNFKLTVPATGFTMFLGCSKLKYVKLENITFISNKYIFKNHLYSLNKDIIVCGQSNFFSNDNSLCEIGTYCINKIYNISGSIEDYHCYIKYREELNETNLICPYYYHENIELNIFIECININITKRIESIVALDIDKLIQVPPLLSKKFEKIYFEREYFLYLNST